MILARKICDEVYAENGEILKADQVVYGLPGATPAFTAEEGPSETVNKMVNKMSRFRQGGTYS